MIKKIIGLCGLVMGGLISTQSAATVFQINAMKITSGQLVRSFVPTDSAKPIALDFTGNTNLVAGYINKDTNAGSAISETNFRMVKDPTEPTQYVYTAASNIRHNDEWNGMAPPADGTISDPAYVVPTGTIDDALGTITMDLSSWFANHMGMNQNLGGIAKGDWNPTDGKYEMSWVAILTQGNPNMIGKEITWTLKGETLAASPVPLPAAIWFLGTGFLGILGMKKMRKVA